MIRVSIGGQRVWALVDSGADFSLVRAKVARSFVGAGVSAKESGPKGTLVGASGEPLHIIAVADIPMLIEQRQFSVAMAVVEHLIYDVVLGRDFACRYGTVLDDRRGILKLGDMEIPLPTYDDIRPSRCRVRLGAAVSVPPRSEMVIAAVVKAVDGDARWRPGVRLEGVLEPNEKGCSNNLLVSRAVAGVDERGQIPLRIINISTSEACLLANTDIGTLYTIRDDGMGIYDVSDGEDGGDSPPLGSGDEAVDPVNKVDLSDSGMSEKGLNQVRALVREFSDIFSRHPGDLGLTHLMQHEIETGDAPPVKQRPRRVPLRLREQVEEQRQQMLRDGVIEPSTSPWCSPIVLAKKKDGSYRFCVDLRAVNKVTKGMAYPLPRVEDALDSLAGAKYFSTLDMASGYWQVELAPKDREKNAFSTGNQLDQFRLMCFGLKNAGASFQKLMELVLAGVDPKQCLVYIDDIILFGRSEDEHIATLREVFSRVRQARMKLKPQKCHLGKREVTFLGHRVSAEGIAPDPSNTEKVRQWPEPQTAAEMLSFLGLCGYYMRFVPGYAEVSKPLREAASAKDTLVWSEAMRTAFQELKEKLTSPPVLKLPAMCGRFRLYTDACNSSVGSVLVEAVGDQERVVAYASKVLSKAERRWPTYDKELWAVVWSVRHFRQYLVGAEFDVVTDHRPLMNLPNSIVVENDATGRRGRWAVELSSYEFRTHYKKGVEHSNADALSRLPAQTGNAERNLALGSGTDKPALIISPVSETRNQELAANPDAAHAAAQGRRSVRAQPPEADPASSHNHFQSDQAHSQSSFPEQGQDEHHCGTRTSVGNESGVWYQEAGLKAAQENDPLTAEIRSWFQKGRPPAGHARRRLDWRERIMARNFDDLAETEGVVGLRRKNDRECSFLPLVPSSKQSVILEMFHDHSTAGHLGMHRTLDRVTKRCYWPGMFGDVKAYCRSCETCQRRHSPAPAMSAPLQTDQYGGPFERVAMDITEMSLTSSGNRYALVVMDYFSKFVRVYPMPDQKAETVADKLLCWVYEHGVPERIHSDQGRQFESTVFKELCRRLGVEKTRTTPYHPEGDGMVERFNRTLKAMVSKYIDPQGSNWDRDVGALMLAYNSSTHSTTGYTPYFLVYGREVRLPGDALLSPPAPVIPVQSFLEDRSRRIQGAFAKVRENIRSANEKMEARHLGRVREVQYRPGDLVLVTDPTAAVGGKTKLGLPYTGPGAVIEKIGGDEGVVYRVQLPRRGEVILHHNRLKPFTSRRNPGGDRVTIQPDDRVSQGQGELYPGQSKLPTAKQRAEESLWLGQMSTKPNTPYHTRSGRAVRPPSRYAAQM